MERGAYEEILPMKVTCQRKLSMYEIKKKFFFFFQYLCFKKVCYVFKYLNFLTSTSYWHVLWTVS